MIQSPYQKYQQSSVQTASPAQLVVMLYDGAIRFLKQSIEGIETKNIEITNTNLIKTQKIVNELIASLNFDYPIAHDLLRIYEYMSQQLIVANLKKDKAIAQEVLEHLVELKEAWFQVAKSGLQATQING